jgi:hypothetical membrane protein
MLRVGNSDSPSPWTLMMRKDILLASGAAFPVLYFATLVLAGIFYPGYDFRAQVPSELGMAKAPNPAIFNIGMLVTAIAAAAGAAGLFLGLRRLRTGILLSLLTSVSLGLFAVSMAMAGLFPLPNPLHHGFNLVLAGVLTPFFGVLALGREKGTGLVRGVLVMAFLAGTALLIVNLGAGGIVTGANAGLWLRVMAVVCFPNIGLLCWTVWRRVPRSVTRKS